MNSHRFNTFRQTRACSENLHTHIYIHTCTHTSTHWFIKALAMPMLLSVWKWSQVPDGIAKPQSQGKRVTWRVRLPPPPQLLPPPARRHAGWAVSCVQPHPRSLPLIPPSPLSLSLSHRVSISCYRSHQSINWKIKLFIFLSAGQFAKIKLVFVIPCKHQNEQKLKQSTSPTPSPYIDWSVLKHTCVWGGFVPKDVYRDWCDPTMYKLTWMKTHEVLSIKSLITC